MLIELKTLKQQGCNLTNKFINDYKKEAIFVFENDMYDTNELLSFLYNYPEINDKSKEFFYHLCRLKFNDIPYKLSMQYQKKFGLTNCGPNIYNSYGCSNSNLLLNCNGISKSFGCSNCKFSNHLLYCENMRHKTYMAFNKPVSRARFKELIALTPEELQNTPEFNAAVFTKINSLNEYIFNKYDTNK